MRRLPQVGEYWVSDTSVGMDHDRDPWHFIIIDKETFLDLWRSDMPNKADFFMYQLDEMVDGKVDVDDSGRVGWDTKSGFESSYQQITDPDEISYLGSRYRKLRNLIECPRCENQISLKDDYLCAFCRYGTMAE